MGSWKGRFYCHLISEEPPARLGMAIKKKQVEQNQMGQSITHWVVVLLEGPDSILHRAIHIDLIHIYIQTVYIYIYICMYIVCKHTSCVYIYISIHMHTSDVCMYAQAVYIYIYIA